MTSFEDLDCWKKTTDLIRKLSQVVKTFPSEEKFRLKEPELLYNELVEGNGFTGNE